MRDEVRLHSPRKDGSTLAEHARAILRQTGAWPEHIPQPPEMPFGLQHVWEAYWDMRSGTGAGLAGPSPLAHAEMLAWNSTTESGFGARHFALLKAMDAAYLEAAATTRNT